MIIKIRVDQIKVGMFIDDFTRDIVGKNGSIKQLLVKNKKTIEIIQSWGIKHVYIDTAKERKNTRARTVQEVQNLINHELHNLAREKPSIAPRAPLKKEIQLARIIQDKAMDKIQHFFNSAEKGLVIDTVDAYKIVAEMEKSITRNQDALLLLMRIKNKDEYTLLHSISVGVLVLAFCKFCGIPHQMKMDLAVSGLLHDLGKTKIPSNILNKPGILTDEEFAIMKKHTEYTEKILQDMSKLPPEAYDIAMHHHERFDGKGYPHGLKGDEISFGSQMVAICDVYDAMISDRCYRSGLDSSDGLKRIYEWSGSHFNKELSYKFIRCIGVYPVGTYVKLENNLIGVVVESTENILQPVVRVFFNDQKKVAISEEDLNLSEMGVSIINYESPDKWQDRNQFVITDNFEQNTTTC